MGRGLKGLAIQVVRGWSSRVRGSDTAPASEKSATDLSAEAEGRWAGSGSRTKGSSYPSGQGVVKGRVRRSDTAPASEKSATDFSAEAEGRWAGSGSRTKGSSLTCGQGVVKGRDRGSDTAPASEKSATDLSAEAKGRWAGSGSRTKGSSYPSGQGVVKGRDRGSDTAPASEKSATDLSAEAKGRWAGSGSRTKGSSYPSDQGVVKGRDRGSDTAPASEKSATDLSAGAKGRWAGSGSRTKGSSYPSGQGVVKGRVRGFDTAQASEKSATGLSSEVKGRWTGSEYKHKRWQVLYTFGLVSSHSKTSFTKSSAHTYTFDNTNVTSEQPDSMYPLTEDQWPFLPKAVAKKGNIDIVTDFTEKDTFTASNGLTSPHSYESSINATPSFEQEWVFPPKSKTFSFPKKSKLTLPLYNRFSSLDEDAICPSQNLKNTSTYGDKINGNHSTHSLTSETPTPQNKFKIHVNGTGNISISSPCQTMLVRELKRSLSDQLNIPINLLRIVLNGRPAVDNMTISCSDNLNVYTAALGGGPGKAGDLHPGKQCSKCEICFKIAPRYVHISQRMHIPEFIKNVKAEFPNVKETTCICRACEIRFRKGAIQNVDKKMKMACVVPNCMDEGSKTTRFSANKVMGYFGFASNLKDDQVFTCRNHYNLLHWSDYNRSVKKCSICEETVKGYSRKVKSSDIDKVTNYLTRVFGKEDHNVSSDSVLCSACNVQMSRNLEVGDGQNDPNRESIDERIAQILTGNDCQLSNEDISSIEMYSFKQSVCYLAGRLIEGRAVLASDLYDFYRSLYTSTAATHSDINEESNAEFETKLKGYKSFLMAVTCTFSDVLLVSTIDSKFAGTMLRKVGNDDVRALHLALYEQKQSSNKLREGAGINLNDAANSIEGTVKEALCLVIQFLRSRMSEFSDKLGKLERADFFNGLDEIDFRKYIEEHVDPYLWNFVFMLTSSDREDNKIHKTSGFDWQVPFTGSLGHTSQYEIKRLMRRLYILSVVLFSYNRESKFPLHMLVADVVDKFSNSSDECLRLLNELGVCVSERTLARFQVNVAEESLKKGPLQDEDTLTCASIDNFNSRECYRRVRCTDDHRGFDETSIQLTQPLPITCTLVESDKISQSSQIQDIQPKALDTPFSKPRRYSIDTALTDKYHQVDITFEDLSHYKPCDQYKNLQVEQFATSCAEEKESKIMRSKLFTFCLSHEVIHGNPDNDILSVLKDFFMSQGKEECEQSNVYYMAILEQNADSQETIKMSLEKLHKAMQVGIKIKYLVVVGDGKTYDHLLALKEGYPEYFAWMLPYPGDFHIMKNYLGALMKLYGDAGLKELVSVFHKGATANAVLQATSFDKTHTFILQVWEAFYRHEIQTFFEYLKSDPNSAIGEMALTDIFDKVKQCFLNNEDNSWLETTKRINELADNLNGFENEFWNFTEEMCKANKTWKFWHNFVHVDCFAHIGFYLAIRSGNWNLRNYCLQLLAPVFHVIPSTFYYKLIPRHMADLKIFPTSIINHFQNGAFVMNFQGNNWNSVGLDEGHEMGINKEVKSALNTFTPQAMSRIIYYLPYRAKMLSNLRSQLGTKPSDKRFQSKQICLDTELNVNSLVMKLRLCTYPPFSLKNDTVRLQTNLYHIFSGLQASKLQETDMMSFREMGEAALSDFIKCNIIGRNSLKCRKRIKLNLFGIKKLTSTQQRSKLLDERKVSNTLRKMIGWSKLKGVIVADIQQMISLPSAICTNEGLPYTSQKCKTTAFFQKRYPECFIQGNLPPDLQPKCLVIDAMFMLHRSPITTLKTFREHCMFLFYTGINMFFNLWPGLEEVRVIFDKQTTSNIIYPKSIERGRRDSNLEGNHAGPSPLELTQESHLPNSWQSFISNRSNKRRFVDIFSNVILAVGQAVLRGPQKITVAGGFQESDTARSVSKDGVQELIAFKSNAMEADQLVCLHAMQSDPEQVVVYSPDTDIWNIILPFIPKYRHKHILVQTNISSRECTYVNLNELEASICHDSMFQRCNIGQLPQIMQTVYIASGCDFTSFFKYHGKVTFFNTFVSNAQFICGQQYEGSLHHTSEDYLTGLLAWYRLVGCVYFKDACTAFLDQVPTNSPSDLFRAMYDDSESSITNHCRWLNKIRTAVPYRVPSEEYYLPSNDAVTYHWKRVCWVSQVWAQSDKPHIVFPDVEEWGWKSDSGTLNCEWDSPENLACVQERVDAWGKGCTCSTGCTTNRCGCRKSGKVCGPGCTCEAKSQCWNSSVEEIVPNSDNTSDESDEETLYYQFELGTYDCEA